MKRCSGKQLMSTSYVSSSFNWIVAEKTLKKMLEIDWDQRGLEESRVSKGAREKSFEKRALRLERSSAAKVSKSCIREGR